MGTACTRMNAVNALHLDGPLAPAASPPSRAASKSPARPQRLEQRRVLPKLPVSGPPVVHEPIAPVRRPAGNQSRDPQGPVPALPPDGGQSGNEGPLRRPRPLRDFKKGCYEQRSLFLKQKIDKLPWYNYPKDCPVREHNPKMCYSRGLPRGSWYRVIDVYDSERYLSALVAVDSVLAVAAWVNVWTEFNDAGESRGVLL